MNKHIGYSLLALLLLNATAYADYPKLPDINLSRDPDDNVVLACAWEAQANYIVSGDKDITEISAFRGIPVFSPGEFMATLEQTQRAA